ncbi:hypothetical protein ACFC26_32965 [Kitasatospora purpeofusca]|uniref:hypothetical protein n=1 Tax=Kitasatospora purpeofusca TaxID=67352 RepID=UPI0035DAA5D1
MTWTSVTKLTIVTCSGQSAGEIELGHPIGVVVSIQAVDEHNKQITVDSEKLTERTKLIDYVTEKELHLGEADEWCYWLDADICERSGLSRSAGFRAVERDGAQAVEFGVTCHANPPKPTTKSIAIEITTDAGKVIRSSMNSHINSKVEITVKGFEAVSEL